MADDRQWNVKDFMSKRVGEEGLQSAGVSAAVEEEHYPDPEHVNIEDEEENPPSVSQETEGEQPWLDRTVNKFANTFSCILPTNIFTEEEVQSTLSPRTEKKPADLVDQIVDDAGAPDDEIIADGGTPPRRFVAQEQAPIADESAPKEEDNHFFVVDPWFDSKQREREALDRAANEERKKTEPARAIVPVKKEPKKSGDRGKWCILLLFLLAIGAGVGVALWFFLPGDEDQETSTDNATVPGDSVDSVEDIAGEGDGEFNLIPTEAPIVLEEVGEDSVEEDASPTLSPTRSPVATLSPTIAADPTLAPTFSDPELQVTITFDDFANEIGWTLRDEVTGEDIFLVSGFTYRSGQVTATHRIPVQFDREYTFTIVDLAGDGLCCDEPGEYSVTFRGETLAFGGGDFGEVESTSFVIPPIF